MKLSFFWIRLAETYSYPKASRRFTIMLLSAVLTFHAALFSQTTPLTFTQIPYSDPDIISPGRGAEQWDFGSEKVNNPTTDTNIQPLDVYYRFAWTVLEGDSINSYNWTFFDNVMKHTIDNKQKLSFGIMPVYDGKGTVIYDSAKSAYPLYLHKLMQSGTANTKDWISHGVWIPNWNSTHYLTRLRALHEALYAHIMSSSYKGVAFKDAIYCIDIRGYGNYGEWHNSGIVLSMSDYPIGRRASAATLRTIIDHHTQVFSQWPLVIMIAAFDADQYEAIMNPAELTYYALTTKNAWGPLGWRRDQWGATDTYLDKILKDNIKTYADSPPFKDWIITRYQTSPITGEPPNYISPGGSCQYWDLERQLMDYGATSMGNGNFGASQLTECGANNVRAAFKRAGYRIILEGGNITSNLIAGKPFSVTLKWKNIGIAPTYENWDVVFELKNQNNATVWTGVSKFKPKRFLPSGEATTITDIFSLPTNIVAGSYKLNMIVKDPTMYRTPLPLAITGRNADGSYTIKDVTASPVGCVPPTAKLGSSPACVQNGYKLILESASTQGPLDLVINGKVYSNIKIGQAFDTIAPPSQKIWNNNPAPNSYEDSPVELGVKFKSSVPGFITGIRFFSSKAPSGSYVGHLWTASGTLLNSATFTNVTADGWQEVSFANPVPIKADTIYVASYHTKNGNYAATPGGLASPVSSGALTALASNIAGGNGLYAYGTDAKFPTNSFNATNYWVDVVFTPGVYTYELTSITDSTGCNNTGNLGTLTVSLSDNCNTAPPVPNLPTAVIANSTACHGETFNLFLHSATGPGPYDMVINGKVYSNIQIGQNFDTITPSSQKIWNSNPAPSSYEDSPVELGVKFKSSVSGFITGIRFFSSKSPSGSYVGHLWTASGTLLNSAAFINVTADGWQEVSFANPVPIKADTIYVASYHTNRGNYAASSGGLSSSVSRGSLTAVASNIAGGNGLYAYATDAKFPTNSFNATNYWVDVVFTPDTYTYELTSITDNTGSNNTGQLGTLTVSLSDNCNTAPPVPNLPTAVIANTTACHGGTFNLFLHSATGPGPYDIVINGTAYNNLAIGQTITSITSQSQKIWNTNPTSNSYEDSPVELGVKFKSTTSGYIKGVRFFSSKAPSGVYTGHLWTATGTLMDSAVFTNVTANGWQEVLFSKPKAIKADSVYIASYHTSKGYYAATAGGLTNTITNGALTVPGSTVALKNGMYSYGSTRTFPSNSFNATNYWVDVIFTVDTASTFRFYLTSVTDSAGNINNGDTLQTLSVALSNCSEAARPGVPVASKASSSTMPVSSISDSRSLPGEVNDYVLGQNYPNPFNKETLIQYHIPVASHVNLLLFDMNGRLIKVLANGSREKGLHTLRFNTGSLSNGIYFYKMQSGNFSAVKKMIIQR